jgi:hypothetical protein
MSRRFAALMAAIIAALAAPTAASANDYAIIARNIIPSGEYGSVPPPGAATQAQMYDALTPLFSHVSAADLLRDFKSEKLGAQGAGGSLRNESVPHAGVTDPARSLRRSPHLRQDL